jgi:xylulokinase
MRCLGLTSALSGSAAYERFTANQILKKKQLQPEVYAKTAHISLISSAMCVAKLSP